MMTESIGTAKMQLTLDMAEFTAMIAAGKTQLSGFGTSAEAAFNASNSKAKSAAVSLARYTELIGKSADEVKLLRAQWAGVDVSVLDAARQKLAAVRGEMEADNQVAAMMSDSFAQMQVKARNAFKELQQGAREEQLLRDSIAAKALARELELAGIKAQHAAQGIEFLSMKADAERVNRMRQAVSAFGGSLAEVDTAENRATQAGRNFIAMVREQEAALGRNHTQMGKNINQLNQYGLTGKQQAAALRQVPAQVTDIAVSLQGGQNPLTVLLQQGGQLKDVFGGIVPAARALGGAVMGLVNPWTITAAVLGTVALAYLGAESRANSFNRSLILTGQNSELNADKLQAMARSLDEVSGITSRQAAAALTEIAASGKIAADQYELVAQAASRMEDVTGKAMKDTVAEYAELARDPVSAILKFNESEKFLTQSIYERIKALQESGQIEEAAALAIETRAQAQIERTQQVVESLGLVSGAWHTIKESTGEAWDEAVSFFADLDINAKEAAGTLSKLWSSFTTPGGAAPFAMQDALYGTAAASRAAAAAEKDRVKVNSEAQRQLDSIASGNRNREDSQKLEIQRIRNLGAAAGYSADKIKQLEAASNRAYQSSLPKGRSTAGAARSLANAEASAQLQAIKDTLTQEQAAIQNSSRLLQAQYAARIVNMSDYYRQTRELAQRDTVAQADALQKQIVYLKTRDVAGKDSVNTLKQIGQLEAQLAKVRADGATQIAILAIQEEDAAKKRRRAIDAYSDSLERSNEAAKRSVDAALARITLGEREAAQQEKIAEIIANGAERRREIEREFEETGDRETYDAKLGSLQEYMDEQVRIATDGYERMKAAQGNWLNGVKGGIANWMEQTGDVARQTQAITNNALDGAADMLTSFFNTGKRGWRDYIRDIGTQIVKFMARQAITKFIEYFVTGWLGGNEGTKTGGNTKTFAKGGVFNDAPSLSAYSGRVVSSPTPFLFARGAGIMGEAGPEAIMPLSRGSDGKLGVKAGGGAGVTLNLSLTVNSDGSKGRQESSDGEKAGLYRQLMGEVGNMVDEKMSRAMMPGGQLWKAGVSA